MKAVYAQLGLALGASAAALPAVQTIYSTSYETVTSCAPSITDCPAASTVVSTIIHSSSAYQCNPAHSYPNGAICDGDARTLYTPAPTTTGVATSSAYQCNPAHSYPNGAVCDGTARTLYTPAPVTTAAASTSAYLCNPAHSYPNGAICDGTARTLYTPAPTTAAAASTSAYLCNPAHSYPNGAICDGTARTLYTPAPTTTVAAASTSAYQCNPAHSYPNGAVCDSTARTLYTPAPSSAAPSSTAAQSTDAPSATTTGEACQTELTGAYETPHLIVPVDKENPDTAYGTQYFASLSSDNSTIFNFDVPTSYAGKQCSVIFLFPEQKDLVTSSFTESGSGGLSFALLASAADEKTTYSNAPAVSAELKTIENVKPGNSYLVGTGDCAAGTKQGYKVSATGDYSLNYFQDWNPSPIGLFMTSC